MSKINNTNKDTTNLDDQLTFAFPDLGDLNQQMIDITDLIFRGVEYNIGIDICNRSRELSKLYVKAKQYEKAVDILNIMMDYCYKVDGLDNGHYVFKDVEFVIRHYIITHQKDKIILLLEKMIDRYPTYIQISLWQEQLEKSKSIKTP